MLPQMMSSSLVSTMLVLLASPDELELSEETSRGTSLQARILVKNLQNPIVDPEGNTSQESFLLFICLTQIFAWFGKVKDVSDQCGGWNSQNSP